MQAHASQGTTLHAALTAAVKLLQQSATDSARLDAEILLAWVLNKQRVYLHTWPEHILTTEQELAYRRLIIKRQQGVPIAYLTGQREFWSLSLTVNPDTLIPRPDTETLVEIALNKLHDKPGQRICDLGTGSGAIALALASERPDCEVLGTDISTASLQVAEQNALHLGLRNIRFLHSDWFEALATHRFELIVSNPPYIAEQDPHLSEGDVAHEPRHALSAGPQGMDDLQAIGGQALSFLTPSGWLLMEHGYQQAETTCNLLMEKGYCNIRTWQDAAGLQRVSGGQRHSDPADE